MKRIHRRALAVSLIAALILGLTALYVTRQMLDGGQWAGFPSNGDAFISGRIRAGTVKDRDGEILYAVRDGEGSWAEDETTRIASLHLIGDRDGFIGSGVLYNYAGEILGYDPVNGLYSRDGQGGVLNLSVDADAQRAAWEALKGRRGAVIVTDYVTGEIICLVSSPSFDPENPPEIAADDTSGVYLNRPLSAAYTPGSIFKLVTLAAAIENLDDLFERDFHCSGSAQIGGGTVTCGRAHGDMKIEDALAESCNCTFAALAVELGGEKLREYADRFGLTSRQTVDGMRTAAGRFDVGEAGSFNLGWSGAGQYHDLVNPAAMVRFVAAIAGRGDTPALTLRRDYTRLGVTRDHIMAATTAEKLGEIMEYAVARTYGADNFPGLKLHAKSGTAEVGTEKPNAWFVGYIEDPMHPYAFAVCVENAGSGASQAGKVANAVLQACTK